MIVPGVFSLISIAISEFAFLIVEKELHLVTLLHRYFVYTDKLDSTVGDTGQEAQKVS